MNKHYSNKSIVFLRFIFLFGLFISLYSNPVHVRANDTTKSTNLTETTKEETLPAAKLNLKAVTLVKEKTYTLKVYNLTEGQTVVFKSDSEDIVSVDDTGLITGLKYGIATVTAFIQEGTTSIAKLTCDVTVGPAAISVTLTKSEHTMVVGDKFTLKTIPQPYNTVEKPKFISYDPSIATVSTGGCITAKSEGKTVIYTVLENGKSDACTITVVKEEPTATPEISPTITPAVTPGN